MSDVVVCSYSIRPLLQFKRADCNTTNTTQILNTICYGSQIFLL